MHVDDHPGYRVSLARDGDDVAAARRLRHATLSREFGAANTPGADSGRADRFDAYCDHLLVRETGSDEIVGTYRLLSPGGALRAGGMYAENEFDLSALRSIRSRTLEIVRGGAHPGHRGETVISLLWRGIVRYAERAGCSWIAGSSALPLMDGGSTAAAVCDTVLTHHLAPADRRVTPLHEWCAGGVARSDRVTIPPFLGAYLRLGAWVCGRPAFDPEFGAADLFTLYNLDQADPRYARRHIGIRE